MKREPKTYSEAMTTLEEIVGRIERGEVDVDELCASVTEAAALVKNCRTRLRTTQEAVEQALKEMDDERKTEPPAPAVSHTAHPPVVPKVEAPALSFGGDDDDADPFV